MAQTHRTASEVFRTLGSLGCAPASEDEAKSMSGSILATYQLLPTFQYCEKLDCYVDDVTSVSENIPPPKPPPTKKAEIFDLNMYAEVDERAIHTSPIYYRKPLRELVDHLIEGYVNDLSKIRAIYRWITCQPIDQLYGEKGDHPKQQHAGFQLWRIKHKKGNYAQLVSLLCRYADIPCLIIHGTLKGSTYEVGDKIDEDRHYGEWNAVLIGKHWRFVNAYWGTCSEVPDMAGNLRAGNALNAGSIGDSTGRLCYNCDENYFLTDPDQMAATHLPANPKWQLKKNPISLREFEEMTFVKDRYFNLRIRTLSHPKCIVRSDTGDVELRFGVPKKTSLDLDFQYLMFKLEKDLKETRCDQYVFMHRTNNQEILTVKIRSPEAATYRFELVGRDSTILDEGYDYDWIAIYRIVFSKGLKSCTPFAKPPAIGWGPGRSALSRGLVPLSHFTGEVLMDDFGKVEIKFGAANKQKLGDMTYLALMFSSGENAEELPNHVVHRVENGDVIINAMTPERGEYMLKLFVKREDELGNGQEICNYLLISNQKEENGHFPRGFTEKLGPKYPQFLHSGLFPATPSGFIRTDQEQLKLTFTRSEDIELSLNFSSERIRPAEAPRLLSQEEDGDKVSYILRMPESGQYGVRLRGTRLDGAVHESLYDYIIDYKKPKKRNKKELTIKQEAETFDEKETVTSSMPPVVGEAWVEKEPDSLEDEVKEDKFCGETNLAGHENEKELEETIPEVLRRRVRMAIEEKDIEELRAAIADMKTLKVLPTVAADIAAAQTELDILLCRRDLMKSIDEKSLSKLKSAVKKTKTSRFQDRIPEEFRVANTLYERLKKLQKLLHAVLNLDQSTISEIRGYNNPPAGVHQVMKATLLVLGYWEEDTHKWINIQKILGGTGRESIKRMIADRNIDKIGLDVALGAKAMLRDLQIEQVRVKSAGAATFYVWVCGVIEEIERRAGDDVDGVRPRTCKSRRRQRRRERSFVNPPKTRKENTFVEDMQWL